VRKICSGDAGGRLEPDFTEHFVIPGTQHPGAHPESTSYHPGVRLELISLMDVINIPT
jgi:hypothetical protein